MHGELQPPPGGTYALTIAPAPTGGTVTGNGLTCGAGGATCAVTLASGTTAALTAAPAAGYTFTSWGGACSGTSATTSVPMDAAKSCTRDVHGERGHDLRADDCAGADGRDGDGERAVVRRDVRGDARERDDGDADGGAGGGYTFTSWGGSCSGTSATTSVLMDAAKTLHARRSRRAGAGCRRGRRIR